MSNRLLRTAKRYALMTVTDKYTKAMRLIACTETTSAPDVAKLWIQHVYPLFGLPLKTISDRDPPFTSGFWRALCENSTFPWALRLHIIPLLTVKLNGQTRQVETVLRCILGGLCRSLTQMDFIDLPVLEHEFNSMRDCTKNSSPNELCFLIPHRSIPDIYLF